MRNLFFLCTCVVGWIHWRRFKGMAQKGRTIDDLRKRLEGGSKANICLGLNEIFQECAKLSLTFNVSTFSSFDENLRMIQKGLSLHCLTLILTHRSTALRGG